MTRVTNSVTQLDVAVTVAAGTSMYVLQNGRASSICLLSTSALRTLSLLHVYPPAGGVHSTETTDSRSVKKIESDMMEYAAREIEDDKSWTL